jgi:hypothetical protein
MHARTSRRYGLELGVALILGSRDEIEISMRGL